MSPKQDPAQLEDIELTASPSHCVGQEEKTSITLVWHGVQKSVIPPPPPQSLLSGVYGGDKQATAAAMEEKEVRSA